MATLDMLRGSDVDFRMVWPGDLGQPFDLTQWDISAFEAHRLLEGTLTLTKGDAAAGEIIGRIEWDGAFNTGASMGFRVQISQGDEHRSTPQLIVNVK